MITKAIKDGILKGLRTARILLVIMIPIYLGVTLLRHTGLFLWLSERIEPAMRVFGLPGEAVIPLVVGAFSDEYSVVAAMSGFSFNMSQVTIIAMVTLIFHGLPVETVIARKIGMPALRIALFRACLAILTGIFVAWLTALFLGGNLPFTTHDMGTVPGATGTVPVVPTISGTTGTVPVAPGTVPMSSNGVLTAGWDVILPIMGWGVLTTVINLLRVLIPLMIAVELMLAYHVIEKLAAKLGFFCRFLRIGQEALLPLLVGLLLGVTYGAGTIMELNRTRPIPKKDLMVLGVFIFSCHGIIENTYLFAINGANVLIISAVRLAIALVVTFAASRTVLR